MLLGLTNDCNLACNYCFVKQQPKSMTYEIAEQAILWLQNNYKAKNRTEKMNVVFFGGEPLLKFNEIIVPIVEKYCNIATFSITTNGILLDEDKIDFFYKYGINILLSFDGIKKVQNAQRPGKNCDSFDTVLKNIPYLLLRFPNTTMRATLTKESVNYLYDTVLMAEELGFKSIMFTPNAYEKWDSSTGAIYEKQLKQIGLHIYKSFFNNHENCIKVVPLIKTFNKIEDSLENKLKYNNSLHRCGLGTTSCAITPEGFIIPCQEKTSNPTYILGDVFNGIDPKKHEEFLKQYITALNEMVCDKVCSNLKECVHCLSNICPSRLEDLKFQFSSATCYFNRITLKVTNRLFTLCHLNNNPWMQNYFQREVK